jgi:hypothetical protein
VGANSSSINTAGPGPGVPVGVLRPALEDHLSASARIGPVEATLHRSETNRQIVILSVFGRDKTLGGWVQLSWTKGGGIKI